MREAIESPRYYRNARRRASEGRREEHVGHGAVPVPDPYSPRPHVASRREKRVPLVPFGKRGWGNQGTYILTYICRNRWRPSQAAIRKQEKKRTGGGCKSQPKYCDDEQLQEQLDYSNCGKQGELRIPNTPCRNLAPFTGLPMREQSVDVDNLQIYPRANTTAEIHFGANGP